MTRMCCGCLMAFSLLRRRRSLIGRFCRPVSKAPMRRESVVLLVLLVGTACDRQPDTIAPPPSPAGLGVLHDAGFPIKPRPECTADVIPAVGRSDIAAIQRLAAGGAAFTCGPAGDPLPLDNAVMKDDPALVLG